MIENLQDHCAPSVSRLNSMSRPELIHTLLLVCHSRRWADRVAAARPFTDEQHLLDEADHVWRELDPADWLEALHGHPRIGEEGGSSQEFSTAEQAGMADADQAVRVRSPRATDCTRPGSGMSS